MGLFRETIPVEEHEAKMGQATKGFRASLASMAAKAGIDVTEEMTNEKLLEEINATLDAAVTVADENKTLNTSLKTAEEANATLTAEKAAAEAKATAAEKVVSDATALFGEKAKEDGFDLVKATGDLVPEEFSASIETQTLASQVPAEYRTKADDYAAELAAGKISKAEFYKKSMALLNE